MITPPPFLAWYSVLYSSLSWCLINTYSCPSLLPFSPLPFLIFSLRFALFLIIALLCQYLCICYVAVWLLPILLCVYYTASPSLSLKKEKMLISHLSQRVYITTGPHRYGRIVINWYLVERGPVMNIYLELLMKSGDKDFALEIFMHWLKWFPRQIMDFFNFIWR